MMRVTTNRIVARLLHMAAVAVLASSAGAADTFKSGTWNVSSLTIQPGDRIIADGDLRIIASGTVEIRGQIDTLEGISVMIRASTIKISGGIYTADGANSHGVGTPGQNAGNITLDARIIEIADARIRAGKGGNGGWSGEGGVGGSIIFIGCPQLLMNEQTTFTSGSGGNGGEGIDGYTQAEMSGGDGGESGDVILDCYTLIEPESPPDCRDQSGFIDSNTSDRGMTSGCIKSTLSSTLPGWFAWPVQAFSYSPRPNNTEAGSP